MSTLLARVTRCLPMGMCGLLLLTGCGTLRGDPSFAQTYGTVDEPCTASTAVSHCTAHVLLVNRGGDGLGQATIAVSLRDSSATASAARTLSTIKCHSLIPNTPAGGYADLACDFDLPAGKTVATTPSLLAIDFSAARTPSSSAGDLSGVATFGLAAVAALLGLITLAAAVAERRRRATNPPTSPTSITARRGLAIGSVVTQPAAVEMHPVTSAEPARELAQITRGSRVALWTSVVICAAVIAGYFSYLARYAANGVFWDEWNWVGMIRRSYAGALSASDLWSQHNENRFFFPNVIALALGNATGFNDMAFMYLGAILLVAAVLLLIVALRRELLEHPLAYVPGMLLFFSLAQYENILWGFQFAWFMVIACMYGVLLLLTVPQVRSWRLLGAIALGTVASYSLIQGLEVWAAGLLPLLRPGTSVRMRAAWCAAGVIVFVFYVNGLSFAHTGSPPLSEFPTHLPTAALGFLVAVGNVLLVTGGGADYSVTIAFGALITIVGVAVVASWWIQGRRDRVLTIAASLVIVGFVFDLLLMPGRLSVRLMDATPSRYTTFNLLILAGIYIGAVRTILVAVAGGGPRRIAMSRAFVGVAAALVFIQVIAATRAGLAGGITTHAAHAEAANLTANYDIAPPTLVTQFCYPPSYEYFETEAAFLKASHLNVFGDGESATYRQTGVLAGGAVSSPLPIPPELGDIRSNPTQWRAWLALSSVYEQRPDLQAAFPGPTQQASRLMVAWALKFGMDPRDPTYSPILKPYADQYKAWVR